MSLANVKSHPQTDAMPRLVKPEPVSGERPRLPAYDPSAPPGTHEHRSIDCDVHGVNVAGYRAYKGAGPYLCCACAIGAPGLNARAFASSIEQQKRAREALWVGSD